MNITFEYFEIIFHLSSSIIYFNNWGFGDIDILHLKIKLL